MREIKFRAGDKELNCMLYEDRRVGPVLMGTFNLGGVIWGYTKKELLVDSAEPNNEDRHEIRAKGIGAFILMQYTGLQDKNGKEIYEGDIVKYWDSYRFWAKAQVKYMNGEFAVIRPEVEEGNDISLRDFFLDGPETSGLEVIGNIYENSDLLPKPETE